MKILKAFIFGCIWGLFVGLVVGLLSSHAKKLTIFDPNFSKWAWVGAISFYGLPLVGMGIFAYLTDREGKASFTEKISVAIAFLAGSLIFSLLLDHIFFP